MKTPTVLVLTGLLAGFSTAAVIAPLSAQAAPRPVGAHAGKKLQKLSEALSLTDAQKEQLRPLLKNAREQAKAIKQNSSLTPDQRKSQLKDLHRSTREQMMAILTPEQREKLKAMKKNHPKKGVENA